MPRIVRFDTILMWDFVHLTNMTIQKLTLFNKFVEKTDVKMLSQFMHSHLPNHGRMCWM